MSFPGVTKIDTSSKYASAYCSVPSRTVSMSLTKVWGAAFKPNGMTLKQKCPKGVMNADLSQAPFDIGICQYPLLRSQLDMYLA